MIMDINNQQHAEINISPTSETMMKSEFTTENRKPSLKRSFDVAFLMMPDDKLRQKQQRLLNSRIEEKISSEDLSPKQTSLQLLSPTDINSSVHIHSDIFNQSRKYSPELVQLRSPRIYDDPSIISTSSDSMDNPKSAFTKVAQARLESPIPPPLSPDQLSCPSMSPPISTTPPRPMTNGQAIYGNFRPGLDYHFSGGPFHSVSPVQALAAAQNTARIKQHLMYRSPSMGHNGNPELLPGYLPTAGFPFAATGAPGHPFTSQAELTGIVRSPAAAAILSTLIPPTLASTLTLTAQNVCAKCNISFRMTSDLVYHMRSHHKSEVATDPSRRKREEKLKCPVCNESFRERHHLTRHMTAHQDKESDNQMNDKERNNHHHVNNHQQQSHNHHVQHHHQQQSNSHRRK